MAERELTVDGDRVVQGREQRPTVVDHSEDAVAEALVVVDEVEVVEPSREQSARAEGEGPRLGKTRRAHHRELQGRDGRRVEVGEFADMGDAERIGLAVEIEARHGRETDSVVDLGPGLACEDLDRVAERDQLTGQVAGVDALPATARVPAVDEEGDAQPTVGGLAGCDALGNRGRCGGTLDLVPPQPETRHGSGRAGT